MTCAFCCIWTTRTLLWYKLSEASCGKITGQSGLKGAEEEHFLPALNQLGKDCPLSCSEMQPGRKLNGKAQEKAKRYSVGYFQNVLVSVSINSALPFFEKRSRKQEEILVPRGFILWLHNLEEKNSNNNSVSFCGALKETTSLVFPLI